MKYLWCLTFATLALAGNPIDPIQEANLKGLNFDQVMDIIGGFFVGMGTDVNTPDLAPCVTNTDVFGGWIQNSVVDFSKHTFDGTKDGFMDLSNAFATLPAFIDKCVPASVEVAVVVEKAVLAWGHPLSLLYHTGLNIILNGAEIFADVSKAMGAYETGNWYEFGFNIGQAAFKVIYIPSSELTEMEDEEVQMFTQGMLNGLDSAVDISMITIPDVSGDLAEGFKLLKKKDFMASKDALTVFAGIFKQMATAIDSGYGGYSVVMLNEAADVMAEPYSFVFAHERGMMINGRSIGKELFLASVDYKMKDWNGVGYYMAKVALNLV